MKALSLAVVAVVVAAVAARAVALKLGAPGQGMAKKITGFLSDCGEMLTSREAPLGHVRRSLCRAF